MKTMLTALVFMGVLSISSAQIASVEKSFFEVQIGYPGIYGFNEFKLANSISLRTELGVEYYYEFLNFSMNQRNYSIPLSINLEPRWYFDLNNRAKRGKKIAGNSAFFLSFKSRYKVDLVSPDIYISESNGYNIFGSNEDHSSSLSFIPFLGIRRVFGNHFTFEVGGGYGYSIFYPTKNTNSDIYRAGIMDVHLRFGYRF